MGCVQVVLVRPGPAGGAPSDGARRHLGYRPRHVGRSLKALPTEFLQFVAAYEADYVTREGRLVIDDPEVQRQAGQGHRQLRCRIPQGLTPPDSVDWDNSYQGNKAFLAQTSSWRRIIALDFERAQGERPEDYYKNTATIEWPLGPPASLPDLSESFRGGFQGRRPRQQRQGVRPLPGGRGLASALSQLFG